MSPLWGLGLLLLPAAGAGAAEAAKPAVRHIQIGIVPRASQLSFVTEGKYWVTDADGLRRELAPHKTHLLEAAEDFLRLGPVVLSGGAKLVPEGPADALRIAGKRYHGPLIVRPNPDGTFTVVEDQDIESYLLGVLPEEMDPGWPLEALKAQAVVARTFAYTQMGKYRDSGFDLTPDTRSQMYGGSANASEAVRRAALETRGEVLGYKGEIMNVYYHACCGGHTADAASVWGGASPPPLRGVQDRYCKASPFASWSAFFSTDAVLGALSQSGTISGALRRFEIGRRNMAGYVREFLVRIGGETLSVRAADFRRWIGNTELRSVRISRIKRRGKGIEFFGSGSGHGVGLCQWGARLQAEKGRGYEKILKFYFPGTTLSVIDE